MPLLFKISIAAGHQTLNPPPIRLEVDLLCRSEPWLGSDHNHFYYKFKCRNVFFIEGFP